MRDNNDPIYGSNKYRGRIKYCINQKKKVSTQLVSIFHSSNFLSSEHDECVRMLLSIVSQCCLLEQCDKIPVFPVNNQYMTSCRTSTHSCKIVNNVENT